MQAQISTAFSRMVAAANAVNSKAVSLSTALATNVSSLASLSTVVSASAGFRRPQTPSILSPSNGSSFAGTAITIEAHSHLDVVPVYCVQVQRATNSGFTENVQESSIAQSSSLSVVMPATTFGVTYYIRARCIDVFGGFSAWSSVNSYLSSQAVEFVGAAQDGTGNQNSRNLSISTAQLGDLYLQSVAYQGSSPTPSGFTKIYDVNSYLDGTTHAVYAKFVSSSAEVAEISAYGRLLVCLRGLTAIPSVVPALSYMTGGVTSSNISLPSGGAGSECLVLGWDRSTSPNALGSGWSQTFGDVGGGVNGYFTPVIGFSASATSGISWTRASGAYAARALAFKLR